jgi:hypothetical protein
MDAHFGDTLSDRFAIAKVSFGGGSQSQEDSSLSLRVPQGLQSCVKFFRADKGRHNT